jgi:hypothetical protein
MQYKTLIARCLLAGFVLHVIAACGPSQNVVQPTEKKGMTAAERKDKRGE